MSIFDDIRRSVLDRTDLDEKLTKKYNTAKLNVRTARDNLSFGASNLRKLNNAPELQGTKGKFEIANRLKATAREIPGVRKDLTSRYKNPVIQFGVNNALNSGQAFIGGLGAAYEGAGQLESPGALNKAKGVGNLIKGTSAQIAPVTGLYQGLNLVASSPNEIGRKRLMVSPTQGDISGNSDEIRRFVSGIMRGMSQDRDVASNVERKETKFKLPVLGEVGIDPVTDFGSMLGYTQNPFNKVLFSATEAVNPQIVKWATHPKTAQLANWLTVTATRGAVEDIILGLGEMPTNSKKDAFEYLATQAVTGAIMEIGGRATFKGIDEVKVKSLDTLTNLYKKLKPEDQKIFKEAASNVDIKWNEKAQRWQTATGEFAKQINKQLDDWYKGLNEPVQVKNPITGEVTEMPRWKGRLTDQSGFIDPKAKIGDDVKAEEPNLIQTRNKAIKERLKTLGADDKRLKVLDKKPKLLVAGGDKIDNAKVQEWTTPVSNRLPAQAGPSKIDDPGRNVSLKDIEQKVYGSATPEKTEFGGEKTGAGAVTDKLRGVQEDVSVKVVGKMLDSDNQAVRTIGRLLQGFGGNLGKSQEQVAKRAEFKGSGTDYANKLGTDTQKYVNDLIGNDPKSSERIWSVMDPERADTKVKYSDLNGAEKEALEVLRDISDFINELNYKNGFIKKAQYEKMKGGKYIARAYEEIDLPPEVADFYKAGGGKLDLGQFKQRKENVDLTSIKDPAYLMGKRLQQALYNDALSEMTGWMAKTDLVSNTKKPGYTKLSEHKMYGDLSGKYVKKDALEDIKGFYFTNDIAQQAYDVFSWYDRNPIRRGYKKLFTIFNPAVRLGNKTSNYVFAWMSGINPATYKKNLSFAKKEFEGSGELYRRMLKDGLVGTDVTKADITRMAQELKVGVDDPSILKRIDDSLTTGYGKTDDMAKISAMKTFLDRGYEYDEAARRVMNGFQNYRTVGWLYDVGAKIPVLGNPFIRFKADLGRILKNGVLEHPFRTASTIVAWKLFTDLMSRASGESAEDRQTREERFGSPRIPLTNVSLAVQTPFGEINAARLIGAYGTNYGDSSNDTLADISDFSPIKDPTDVRNYGSDPVIGPIISTLTDTDFRGKSIKDPDKSKYRESQLTPEEQNANRAKFLVRAFTPPVINSALDINAAMKGEENFYGKVRTPGQAILRTYPGIKMEQFGPEEAQASREKDATYAKNRNDYLQREITSIKKGILNGDIEESVGQRRIANFVNQMKDVGGGVPNIEASGAFTIPASKEDRELLKDVIKTKIEINSASPKELEYYYLYDALKMPSENRYETALKEDSLWGAVGKIEKDESLPPEQQAQLIKKVADEMGLKPAHIAYQRVARQNNDKKTLFAMDRLDNAKTDKERMDILVSGRLFVDGDYILSNGVIDNLVDEGYIDYGEGETLKKMKIDPKTGKAIQTGRLKKRTRSSSSKSGKAVTGLKTYKSTPVQFGGSKLPTLRLTL